MSPVETKLRLYLSTMKTAGELLLNAENAHWFGLRAQHEATLHHDPKQDMPSRPDGLYVFKPHRPLVDPA